MTSGFGGASDGKAKVFIEKEEVEKLIKEYKKIKKYMKSPIFAIKNLDGTETAIKSLLEQYGDEDI